MSDPNSRPDLPYLLPRTRGEGEETEFLGRVIQQYKQDVSRCPFCGSADIAPVGTQHFDDDELLNPMDCKKCERRWWEVYKLRSIYPDHTHNKDKASTS